MAIATAALQPEREGAVVSGVVAAERAASRAECRVAGRIPESCPAIRFGPTMCLCSTREHVDPGGLLDSAHVTDSYLLALARVHDGRWPRLTNGWLTTL